MTLPDNGDVASYGDIYWDNPASLYGTWGYKSWISRPELSEQVKTQIGRLRSTVSHGGVFLLNIGPDGSGEVIDYEKMCLTASENTCATTRIFMKQNVRNHRILENHNRRQFSRRNRAYR